MQQVLQSAMDLLQIATGITKCDGFITNCDRYYKVRWICYKLQQVLQSAMDLLQIATGITKCDDYYKLLEYTILLWILAEKVN